LVQADASGPSAVADDLDAANDENLSVVAATATARQQIVFAAAGDLGFINLDQAGQRTAVRGEHAAAQLGAE
jgi:hypothetical protein